MCKVTLPKQILVTLRKFAQRKFVYLNTTVYVNFVLTENVCPKRFVEIELLYAKGKDIP